MAGLFSFGGDAESQEERLNRQAGRQFARAAPVRAVQSGKKVVGERFDAMSKPVAEKMDYLVEKAKPKLQAASMAREQMAFEAGRAAAIAMQHQQVNFSEEQKMLQEMFGHGDKIWGTNQEPVRINNDLNPSRSDPWDETASMFGNGMQGERSGLF